MKPNPSPSYSITIRIEVSNRIGMFAKVATAISKAGGDLGYVNIVSTEKGKLIREVTVNARDDEHERLIVSAVDRLRGVRVLGVADQTFTVHQGGKISIQSKTPVHDSADLAPGFGGINLEDISAPRCFVIERRLQEALDIPVFHDDQHGTAVVVLAGLINAGKLLKKDIRRCRVVIAGAGAAGIATAILLHAYGIKDMVVCDRAGALFKGRRKHMNYFKRQVASMTNPRRLKGTLGECMKNADVFIGVSGPDIVSPEDVQAMAGNAIVFALANPDPEVAPEEIHGLVRIMATGRSDYPNQINNMLAFPGIFRGLLDSRAKTVNCPLLIAASGAIAETISEEELHEDYIIPSLFDPAVVKRVAEAVSGAALKTRVTAEADR